MLAPITSRCQQLPLSALLFPDFPNFFGNLHYFLKGKTLNLFRKALYEQVPIEGAGIILQETNDGIIITSQAGRATTTASVIDFTGTLSGGDVTIRGGKVLMQRQMPVVEFSSPLG